MLWVILKSLLVTVAALVGFGCLTGAAAHWFFRRAKKAEAQIAPLGAA